MRSLLTIAGRELLEGYRNRWVLAATALLAALALALAFVGSAPVGTIGASPLAVTVVSLSSLTIYLIPLIALLLSYDAMVGEVERGTMLLLLTYPVARWQVVVGKFLGHVAILAGATLVGYGGAGLAVGLMASGTVADDWAAFAAMVASSVLLGVVFLALGYLVSVLARERAIAAGLAIGLWLLFVVLFDMALLGALVVDQGQVIDGRIFPYLLLLNPADVYRLFNLAGFENVRAISGLTAVADGSGIGRGVLLVVLLLWAALPLALAGLRFRRREL